jgi:hypothetical protein
MASLRFKDAALEERYVRHFAHANKARDILHLVRVYGLTGACIALSSNFANCHLLRSVCCGCCDATLPYVPALINGLLWPWGLLVSLFRVRHSRFCLLRGF